MTESKEYLSVRVDAKFKNALVQAAETEHRALSNFCRLLLEFAFEQYQQAGSLHDLLHPERQTSLRRRA